MKNTLIILLAILILTLCVIACVSDKDNAGDIMAVSAILLSILSFFKKK